MLMLSIVYTIVLVVAGAFALWTFTKSGKKWLKNL